MKPLKKILLGTIIAIPTISSAQSVFDNMYTKAGLFTKEVKNEKMLGIESAAGVPIGKYASAETIMKFSQNFDNMNPVSNMEIGLYGNATTNNQKNIIGYIGVGIKGQSEFSKKEEDMIGKKRNFIEPAIRAGTEMKLSRDTYFHAGWEYGLDTRQNTFLTGLKFEF